MRQLLLAAACVVPFAAAGQTVPIPTKNGLPSGAPAVAGDPLFLAQVMGFFGAKCNTDASACTVIPSGASAGDTLANMLADYGVQADRFRQLSDGADDAPSMQRAIAFVCSGAARANRLEFRPRHYAIHSQVSQPCTVDWHGQGYQEQLAGSLAVPTAPGTWFDLGSEFIGKTGGQGPFLITGGSGSVVEGFGVSEPGMPAAPVPVCDPAYPCGTPTQHILSYSPSSWTPAGYWYAFEVQGSPGVLFRHLMLSGVNAGFLVNGSGRTSFRDIKGQVFGPMFNIQESYDVSRITDVHDWPYWSSADPVMLFQQGSAKVIVSGRNDSPFWDNIFGFQVQSVIDIFANGDGTTTGAQAGKIQCDSTIKCINVEAQAVAQVTMSVAQVRTFDQAWSTIYTASPAAPSARHNAGSTLLQLDGSAIIQIGQAENYGTDASTVTFNNPSSPSNVQVGSVFVHENQMSPNSVLAKFPTASGAVGSALTLSMPPLLAGTISGWQLTNTSPNGSGIGTLQYATPTVVH